MHPCPSCLVAAQSENSLQPQGAGAILLARHPPDCPEPQGQRLATSLEDRSSLDRSLVPTFPALKQPISPGPCFLVSTGWTMKPRRPAQPEKILPAGLLRCKPTLQIHQRFRIVLHALYNYILWLPQSRRYPYWIKQGTIGWDRQTNRKRIVRRFSGIYVCSLTSIFLQTSGTVLPWPIKEDEESNSQLS